MRKKYASKLTATDLLKNGVPAVLIPGILVAMALGWNGGFLQNLDGWKNSQAVFPSQGIVKSVEDGDTFILDSGRTVRLLGINAPERGESGFEMATEALSTSIEGKRCIWNTTDIRMTNMDEFWHGCGLDDELHA